MKKIPLRVSIVGLLAATMLMATLLTLGCLPIGPIGPLSGGRLRGLVHEGAEPDWNRFAEVRIVELQVDSRAPRSVNVGFFVEMDRPFVSATLRPNEKRWPASITKDPHVVIRVNGTLYPRLARRIEADSRAEDKVLLSRLFENARQKFDPSFFETNKTWFFELEAPD